MAHDHLLRPIHPYGSFIHRCTERLRCKSHSLRSLPPFSLSFQFSNVHDVSWGTKGDNKPAASLGAVATTGKKNEVEVEVPTSEKDINALYEDAIHVLNTKPPKVEQKVDSSTQQEDYYRNFRTNVLLAWTLTNGLLAAAITSTSGSGDAQKVVGGYMAFLLFSVAGLACKSLLHVVLSTLTKALTCIFQLCALLDQRRI